MTIPPAGAFVSQALQGIAVLSGKRLLILEDDAVTHPELQRWIERSELCREADMVLFAINTDSVIEAISPEGVRQISVFREQHPSYALIGETLARTKLADVRTWRLLRSFGLCCYLVTPKGAAKLTQQLLPLRLDGVEVPLIPTKMPGVGVDRRLIALLDDLDAHITMPFLAWTPNADSATRR